MQITDGIHAFLWKDMTANNCNTYLIDGAAWILVDPGHARLFDHVREGLSELKADPADIELILCTHCHPDHIEAVRHYEGTRALKALHRQEWQLIRSMEKSLAASGIPLETYEPDIFVQEGDLSVHGIDLEIYHVPGHSPGSVALYWPQKRALFTGDVVFAGGIGRTDLPGGDGDALRRSIQQLAQLDVEWLLPGHGEIVQGAEAVRRNFDHLADVWLDYI